MSTKNDILGVTKSGRTIPGVAPGIAGAGVGAGAAAQLRPTEPSTTPGTPILNGGAQNGQQPQTTAQTQQAKPAGQPVVQPQQQAAQAQQQTGQPQQQATQQKAADVSKAGAETQQPTPSDKQTTWEGMERYGTPRNDNPEGIVTPYAPGMQVDKEHPYKQSSPSDGWSESFKKANPQLLDEDGNVDPQKLQNYTNEQLYDYLEKVKKENPDETPEEKKKRLRREKWKKIIAAIGDGVSSLANLYYTTKGAPNGYDSKTKLSDAYQARLDKLNEERQKRHEELLNAYQKQYAMAGDMAKQKRENEYWNNKNAMLSYQLKKDAEQWELQAELLEQQGKKAEADAARAKAQQLKAESDAKWSETLNKDKHENYVATANQKNAAAHKSNVTAASQAAKDYAQAAKARSGGSSGGGKGNSGGYPWYDKSGNLHYAKTEGIAKQMSKQNGTYKDDYATNSSKKFGITSTSTTHSGWHSEKPKAVKGTQSRGTAAAHRTAGAKQRSSARARAAAQAKAAGF